MNDMYNHQSNRAAAGIPEAASKNHSRDWRCRTCNALLGVEAHGELHIKYRDAQHWITGRCRHACRRCGSINTFHVTPSSPAPRPPEGGAR
jgi:phage FluMu protein Com